LVICYIHEWQILKSIIRFKELFLHLFTLLR